MNWEYSCNENNTARFTLGEYKNAEDKTLICVGINPSTATPNHLDPTLKKVKAIATNHNYVNWVMINVYPQRATNPDCLHQTCNATLHGYNLNEINNLLTKFKNTDILFAFGDLIDKRPYLKSCLSDILKLIQNKQFTGQAYCIKRTKNGNPVHPLYQKTDSDFSPY